MVRGRQDRETYGTSPPCSSAFRALDDERDIGNGIIVTLRPGHFFYDDCGVMGFDTPAEALDALLEVYRREQTAAVRT